MKNKYDEDHTKNFVIKYNLCTQELEIIKLLYSAQRYLTTRQVSTKYPCAWITAKKNLDKLKKRGWVVSLKRGNRIYWKLIIEVEK